MLSGHYVLYLTMPHLSLETLLPAALLTTELTVRDPSRKTSIWLALAVLLILLGGMPESSLVVLAFLACYALFRMAADREVRRNWRSVAPHLAFVGLCGLGLSSFLLAPFYEFTRQSFDVHQMANVGGMVNGLLHDQLGPSIFTHLFPLLFGPPTKPDLNGARHQSGRSSCNHSRLQFASSDDRRLTPTRRNTNVE